MKKQPLVSEQTLENPYIPKPYKILEYIRETPDTFTIKVDIHVKHEPG